MMHVYLAILLFCVLSLLESTAFITQAPANHVSTASSTSLDATSCGRRDAFFGMAIGIMTVSTTIVSNPEPAEAKYSDYARREKDWEERTSKGEIQISNAKNLRKQLAELVPENNEGSKIFCPNGASAAVSPLMENKCSDTLMALPSVYGRSNDVTGNSIPGFSSNYNWVSVVFDLI